MKKISRFRKWLIHKLGGLTPIEYALTYETIPSLNIKKVELKEIKVAYRVNSHDYLSLPQDIVEARITNTLKQLLMEQIKPTIIHDYDMGEEIYTAIIKVSSENEKEGVKND